MSSEKHVWQAVGNSQLVFARKGAVSHRWRWCKRCGVVKFEVLGNNYSVEYMLPGESVGDVSEDPGCNLAKNYTGVD